MTEPGPCVHHHVLLQWRGGAAKVARALVGAQGGEARLSFEVEERGALADGPAGEFREPGSLAQAIAAGDLAHVHATRDWAALLGGFASKPRPLVITAHDCSLVTGGCVYPLGCPHHARDCREPCPRGYPSSAAVRALKRSLVRAASPVLVSPSSWLAGMLRREWPDLAVKVIPNGVEIPPGRPDKVQARSRLGIAPQARVALFLAHGGVRAAYKGGDRFEALVARMAALVPGFLGIVAGGDEAKRDEAALYLPYVEADVLAGLFEAADVLVYPSLADNHPLVILEAMARGLPVAAYAVGGVVEQVVEGETGLLAPALDEQALARSAARILSGAALARAMGVKARDRTQRLFSPGRMAAAYALAYRALKKGLAAGA